MSESRTTANPVDTDEKAHVHSPVTIPSLTSTSNVDVGGATPPELVPARRLARWNESPINMYRFFAALYSFVILGMNDACLGPLIPYIEEYYGISYTAISTAFLSSCAGYVLAGLSNNLIHHHWGRRGVAIIGPLCHFVSYVPVSFHPPYPAILVLMAVSSFGTGLEDGGWNAWIGNLENANELMGILHGAYGAGATLSPLIATAMVTKANLQWYAFFYLMTGMSVVEIAVLATAFWGASGAAYRESHKSSTGQNRTTTRRVVKEPITWLVALFLLGYVGAEVSLGGWITTFMLNIRHAEPFAAGMAGTGFWLGLTVGRILLGFVTGRVGEKGAITIYLLMAIGLEFMYWFIPSFVASAVIVAFMGFFLGPLFPGAIIVATKILPSDFHVSAIGVAASVGGCGAAVIPFAVGAIAQHKGVQVLQPIILAVFVFILVIWWVIPGGLRRGGLERARDKNEKVGYQIWRGWRHVKRRLS